MKNDNMKNNVISLKALRDLKNIKDTDPNYELRISKMQKLDLLEEMIRFQEERSKIGQLTLNLMIKGRILFSALENHAETQELKLLSTSYRRHLEYEMKDFMKRREQRSKLPSAYEDHKLKN